MSTAHHRGPRQKIIDWEVVLESGSLAALQSAARSGGAVIACLPPVLGEGLIPLDPSASDLPPPQPSRWRCMGATIKKPPIPFQKFFDYFSFFPAGISRQELVGLGRLQSEQSRQFWHQALMDCHANRTARHQQLRQLEERPPNPTAYGQLPQ